jgi:hypothetical protein
MSRNDLAAYWGGDEAGVKKWKGRKLDDPETILAYTRFCRRMIDKFKPDYLAYGVEVNMLAEARAPHSCIAYAARSWNHPAISSGLTSCKAEPNAA